MKVRLIVAVLLLVAWPSGTRLDAGDLLTMKVTPAQSFAPAILRVRVRMVPSADNRWLEVVADSGSFYRSSLMQLDGDRAPQTMSVEFRGIPGGAYEIHGILSDGGGHERAHVCELANVIPSGGER